jgi:DNA-binding MarR family transcriptional regulator
MSTNESTRAASIAKLMESFDGFMRRIAATHAPEFTEVSMTMAQAKLLYTVQSAGGLRMSDLAVRLGVAISTVSGLVDRLVDAGWLDRRDDPADRRQVVVTLTERGAATLERMRELNADHLRRLLAHVTDDDLRTVERAMAVLRAAAVAMAAAGSTAPKSTPKPASQRPLAAASTSPRPITPRHRKDLP